MSKRPGIEVTIKVRLDTIWDGPTAALFGTPHGWAEDFCERVKDKLQVDEAEVLEARLLGKE